MYFDRPTALLGGDMRQAQIANHLHRHPTAVYCFYLESCTALDKDLTHHPLADLADCEIVILPLPLSTDDVHLHAPFCGESIPLERIFSTISKSAKVFGGSISQKVRALAEAHGVAITDYLECSELAVANAAITAEAAIAIAIQETPKALLGAHILVTGYGRIGKALLQRLGGMGATLSCAARKWSDLAEIKSRGVIPVHMDDLSSVLKQQSIIFNTVPAMLFHRQRLQHIQTDALLVDLASKPGGVDFTAAADLGVPVIWALSLPGKSSPITAGEIILDAISHCITGGGHTL